jgi:hypothetical protein
VLPPSRIAPPYSPPSTNRHIPTPIADLLTKPQQRRCPKIQQNGTKDGAHHMEIISYLAYPYSSAFANYIRTEMTEPIHYNTARLLTERVSIHAYLKKILPPIQINWFRLKVKVYSEQLSFHVVSPLFSQTRCRFDYPLGISIRWAIPIFLGMDNLISNGLGNFGCGFGYTYTRPNGRPAGGANHVHHSLRWIAGAPLRAVRTRPAIPECRVFPCFSSLAFFLCFSWISWFSLFGIRFS